MADERNRFLEHMEAELMVLPDEAAAFRPEDIGSAVKSGRVGKAPVSIHRDAGNIYWINIPLVAQTLGKIADDVLPYCGSTGEPPLVGSADFIAAVDGNLNLKRATFALVYARERGKVAEYEHGGHSYFVVPGMENDPRVKKFLDL